MRLADALLARPDALGWRIARTIDVALTILGWAAVVGLAAVALHGYWWGLVLGAAATLTAAYALEPGWVTRLPFTTGWLVPVILGIVPRPEGDYAVAGNAHGYGLIAIGLVLIVLTTATLPLGQRVPRATDATAGTGATALPIRGTSKQSK